MTTTAAMLRLRQSNPAPSRPHTDNALFAAITATPPPAAERATCGPVRDRTLRGALVLAAAALVVGVGAAWAATGNPLLLFQGPLDLFRANPQYDPSAPGDELWRQQVVPGSVTEAATVSVPGLGRVGFWYADTRQGGWCGALKLPDGTWNRSPVPGCQPTRKQVNAAGDPVYVIDGFDYDVATIPLPGGSVWNVYYGIVSGKSPAVRVVDTRSGAEAPVAHGKLFALAEADPSAPPPAPPYIAHLVAYGAQGTVVAQEPESSP